MGRFFSKKSKKSRSGNKAFPLGRKLRVENLESRQMLAADLAEITGVVSIDVQGDNDASNDVAVAGANVALFLDNGNGVLDAGDAQVRPVTATDSTGTYRFNELGAGRYFIQVSLPDGLQFPEGADVQSVVISEDEADGIVGPTLDGFTTFQLTEASPPPVSSDSDALVDPDVLGGERDLFVELIASSNPISSVSLASSNGSLFVASGPGATGNVRIVWDGVDGNGAITNTTGLGGIDLTQTEDGNTLTGISLTSGADHPNSVITLRVYTDANNWSEYTTIVPESAGGAAIGEAIFNFDDIPTAQLGQGADFTNVGALELTLEGVTAIDAQISLVGLVGRATRRANFTASPGLSLGDRVFADINDDGIFQPGESGIAGVRVNVYEDTNGDNQFTNGVDQLIDTQETNAEGEYLFTGLLPNDYIVQVDPTNFQTGGPLAGLRSSLVGAAPVDPDNNVNNDDDGTTLAGAGVVSQAITLIGNTEPTNDGDTDSNSNLSVDFGFFGFDLELDKEVEQDVVTPGSTLNYTITINNNGPSISENTTLSDILPLFTTFVSASTNLPGVTVQENSGVLTADLGTLQPGQEVVITVVSTVDADAALAGTLVNTATVSAPLETGPLSNNTDSVINPVNSVIDLAITKTDSRDPVEPGSTFTYILDIVNNGPSDATGVVITDTLPATGVSFVSASQTPSSIVGDVITFDIGNLASGETAQVTLDVQVDQGFSGTLVNVAEVRGNEQETTTANNIDDEPTLVESAPASIAGSVFVDRNDNGEFEAGETPLANVVVDLEGTDFSGNFITRTTTTAADGSYLFDNLPAGNYLIFETQPSRFLDGQEHIGTNGGATGTNPGLNVVPNNFTTQQVDDLFLGIQLNSGDNAVDYDFGELSIGSSKIDFIRSFNWR